MEPLATTVLALMIPLWALHCQKRPQGLQHPYLFSLGSFLCCGFTLIIQLIEVKRRIFVDDFDGIEDTILGVIIISVTVLVLTLVFNWLLLGREYEQFYEQKEQEETK